MCYCCFGSLISYVPKFACYMCITDANNAVPNRQVGEDTRASSEGICSMASKCGGQFRRESAGCG